MKLTNPLKGSILKEYPQGNIYQFFGENVALYQAAIGTNGHTGIDIAMPEGTPVLASHNGTVVEVKNTPNGYGRHIRLLSSKIDNVYYLTVYGHLGDIFVKVGQEVKAGQKIALESNTGFVISGGNPYWGNAPSGKGVHLHFDIALLSEPVAGYQISYLGKGYSILNYNNGFFGRIDPMPFFTNMLKLVKEKDRNAVYAIIAGKYYWISAEAMGDLVGEGLASWTDVVETDAKIEL